MIKINTHFVPEKDWNGEYLIISSYKPHPSEVKNYYAKRTYYVHAVYKYTTVFVGRYFNLRDARKAVRLRIV